ncbi:MAG: hypothetical protein ACPGVL_15645, partial [Pseudoalteromonas spongiae]
MCSIFGILDIKTSADELRPKALECSRLLRHRGPDWSGIYHNEHAILVHERLAIVDTENGAPDRNMNNPLNDISEVYMESVSEAYSSLKDKEKDAMLDKARIHDLNDPAKAASLRGAVDVDAIRNKPRNTIFKK